MTNKDRQAVVDALKRGGQSVKEIADQYGYSRYGVYLIIEEVFGDRKEEILAGCARFSDETVLELMSLLQDGMSLLDISKQTGLPLTAIKRALLQELSPEAYRKAVLDASAKRSMEYTNANYPGAVDLLGVVPVAHIAAQFGISSPVMRHHLIRLVGEDEYKRLVRIGRKGQKEGK